MGQKAHAEIVEITTMAKSKVKKQDQVEINLPGTQAAEFGEDELGQIRGLLFGKFAQETLERVDRVERELLSAIENLTKSVATRFSEMDSRLVAEVDVRTTTATTLHARVDEESKNRKDACNELQTALDRQATDIQEQLSAARAALTSRIDLVEAEGRERNVDRAALAGLFENAASNLTSSED